MMNPIKNTNEKVNNELPISPSVVTNIPTNKTAIAVSIRPLLKQKPVAVPLNCTGNSAGMYTDKTPWLIPKKKAIKAISAYTANETVLFVLNNKKEAMLHTAKHKSNALRAPA